MSNLHPYKLLVMQSLKRSDIAAREVFSTEELKRISGDEGHLPSLLFTDEAVLYLEGAVNR